MRLRFGANMGHLSSTLDQIAKGACVEAEMRVLTAAILLLTAVFSIGWRCSLLQDLTNSFSQVL